jgi:hypothetical protein
MTFPVVFADFDHRLLSGNPSGCTEVSQLSEYRLDGFGILMELRITRLKPGVSENPGALFVQSSSDLSCAYV